MPSLTFFGGVNEIGGNKILLEDKDTKIFLDFGESFSFGKEFFTGYLYPRLRFGLKDYFALNLMPKLPGLYSEEALAYTDLKYTEPEYQAILLSHIHYDHVAHIGFVDESIPILLGETTLRMLESWETTGRMGFGSHAYYTFRTGDVITIDDIEVEPIHVDHSTPASYGFVIYTSEGAIVYTGDLRMHGPKAEMTEDFIERAKEAEPIALICEGTRVMPEEKRTNMSEREVFEYCNRVIASAKKLVLTCFYPRDVDRMKTFHELAKRNKRKFVVSTKVAHLLETLVNDPGIEVPSPLRDENMLIYVREMNRYFEWEKEFINSSKAINAEYVNKHQDELILHLDFTNFTELIDIRPEPGSEFIHSMSEPFEEGDIEEEVKNNWLRYFNLRKHQAHASGHCSMEEIFWLVEEISPELVFPVHTEYAEMFSGCDCKVVIPEKNKGYKC